MFIRNPREAHESGFTEGFLLGAILFRLNPFEETHLLLAKTSLPAGLLQQSEDAFVALLGCPVGRGGAAVVRPPEIGSGLPPERASGHSGRLGEVTFAAPRPSCLRFMALINQ